MKLSKKKIEIIKAQIHPVKTTMFRSEIVEGLIDTIEALHASITTLANQFESQGRIAEAREVRGLLEEE